MYRYIKIFIFILGISLIATQDMMAQGSINNFYSAFGIGDIETRDFSRNFGMGSAGMARKSASYLNELNPASYTGLMLHQFIFDIALGGKSVTYSGKDFTQSAFDLNLKKIAFGTKLTKWWGSSIGFTPYSTVDYKMLTTKYISGTDIGFTSAIEGSGGINKLYFSNGFQLTKNFFLGLSSALLFGNITVADSLGSNGSSEDVFTENFQYMYNSNFTAGLQYEGHIGDTKIGIGATYRFETKFNTKEEVNIKNTDQESLYSETVKKKTYTLPGEYGIGVSVKRGNATFVADYKEQDWSRSNPNGLDYSFTKAQKIGGGVEYAFQKRGYNGNLVDGFIIQAGLNYQQGYLKIKNQAIKDYGFTLGGSLPSRNNSTRYYLGLEFGQRGTTAADLIKESYININFNLTLQDIMFLKRKNY